jgi:hypothetical protein
VSDVLSAVREVARAVGASDVVPRAEYDRVCAELKESKNRVFQLEYGRGGAYCGSQHGRTDNHGGGCGQKLSDSTETYRCLQCGGVFHKGCLQDHFVHHSGETKESLRKERDEVREELERLRREPPPGLPSHEGT